jgi:hypothetical protein
MLAGDMRVFLSYSRSDRERANGVRVLLELGGAEVFMDWRSIEPGEDWQWALERALARCDVLCIFWSARTAKSKWVEREYTTFLRLHPGRRCVPLVADETPLPTVLAARQAPAEFLALANEILAKRRKLIQLGVSRAERARLLCEEIEKRGIQLTLKQRRALATLFGSGLLLWLLCREVFGTTLAKTAGAAIVIVCVAIVAWPRGSDTRVNENGSEEPDPLNAPTRLPSPGTDQHLTFGAHPSGALSSSIDGGGSSGFSKAVPHKGEEFSPSPRTATESFAGSASMVADGSQRPRYAPRGVPRGIPESSLPGPPPDAAEVSGLHLRTFDGLRYDMQAIGELILVRDSTDGAEVQIRTARWGPTDVAVNTAVAARNGGDVVAFYLGGTVRINHLVVPVVVDGGRIALTTGSLYRHGNDYTLEWPDGMRLVLALNPRFISLWLYPSDSRRGHVLGLLGNFDGDHANDLVTRAGETLAPRLPFELFYRKYVEGWRITQAESLFDYRPRESTSTFTDRAFPSTAANPRGLVDTTDAVAVCRSAGVSTDWLDACVLDVGATGDLVFAHDLAKQSSVAATVEVLPPTNATQ